VEPLEGIRVVELTTGVLGPIAGVYLSDMGAEVVKVEPPTGDLTRFYRGLGCALPPEAQASIFAVNNRGKRSVVLDAHTGPGREALRRLVATADVVLTNYQADALERIGLTYDDVRAIDERIVYAIGTGFGLRGPDADQSMVDGAGQGRGGISSVTGDPDGPPLMVGALIADTAGGMQLALATVTALLARERHGVGQRVDISALGAQLWLQTWEIGHTSMTGYHLTRSGAHHPNFSGTYGTYRTADGGGLFIGAVQGDDAWRAFCAFAGNDELGASDRWDTFAKRAGMSPGMTPEMAMELRGPTADTVRRRTLDDWKAFLRTQPEIIWGWVQNYEEVLDDPQNAANEYIVEVDLPVLGPTKVVGNLVGLSETPASMKGAAPAPGEHTAETLLALGFSEADIEAVNAAAAEALKRKLAELGIA
jgi:crotonobetainyl-CoA:carnitine CoA-transferase CaiB-like acyl-CoA transferase